jgi:hypothetical protein
MKNFHAVMIDETGAEFGADCRAVDHSHARKILADRYPESRIDQLEDNQEMQEREERMYERLTADRCVEWGD